MFKKLSLVLFLCGNSKNDGCARCRKRCCRNARAACCRRFFACVFLCLCCLFGCGFRFGCGFLRLLRFRICICNRKIICKCKNSICRCIIRIVICLEAACCAVVEFIYKQFVNIIGLCFVAVCRISRKCKRR